MRKNGAQLAVHALEQIGVQYTFGIPGVHNTELYDALNSSEKIEPILVTHEGGGAFMADAVSRTSDHIGTMVIVPAAGMTHAMSGIGEAFLDGIPMLVISGGTRRDSGRSYQLHQIDQGQILEGITKKYYLVENHETVIETIYDAYKTAVSGEPGPVFVEIPIEIQLFTADIAEMPAFTPLNRNAAMNKAQISEAAELLANAKKPGIFVGWGAVDASEFTKGIAELLAAPVSTTLQGLSAFPADHAMHTGVGFGPSSIPASQAAFKDCDCLLAVGTRFGELSTGSFGVTVPENLIHIDINPAVFNANYEAKVAIEGDANNVLPALLRDLESRDIRHQRDYDKIAETIGSNKKKYRSEWLKDKRNDKVSPGHFFEALRAKLDHDVKMVVDDGKHTFLTAELFPVYQPRHFISPTDFNCMGYCVPASIGTKLANRDAQVAAIVGDGAFLMTCMELLTGVSQGLGIMVFVFHDGELGQISQFQKIPLNRKTCTVLNDYQVAGVAQAVGAHFVDLPNDHAIDSAIEEAISVSATGKPVIVDVKIDYSKKTFLTKGVVKTNLSRFPNGEKVRFLARAVKRHVLG